MTTATQVYTAGLWCSNCGAETEHLVLYAGAYIKEIRCTVCDATYTREAETLRDDFVHDLPKRARRLAHQGVHEIRYHPREFLPHLPQELLVRSLGFCAELYAITATGSNSSRHRAR